MSDERILFDLAAQPMRPELVDRLEDLYDLLIADPSVLTLPPSASDEAIVVDLVPVRDRVPRTRGRRGMWVLIAASLAAVVAGLAVIVRTSGDGSDVVTTAVENGPQTDAVTCSTATPLGERRVGDGLVLVAAVSDGRFCLDAGRQFAVGTTSDSSVATEPHVIDSGPIDETGGYFYVFAIPQNILMDVVFDESGAEAVVFVNPIGRRVLIIEDAVDPASADVQRIWELRSSSGGSFGSLNAIGPLPGTLTATDNGGA